MPTQGCVVLSESKKNPPNKIVQISDLLYALSGSANAAKKVRKIDDSVELAINHAMIFPEVEKTQKNP